MSALKNISYFIASAVLSKPLGFLLSIILARSLGPSTFGIWITLLLIVSYSPILALGTVETLLKQVPYFLGRREGTRVHEVEDSVMACILIASAAVVLIAAISLLILPSSIMGVPLSLLVIMLIAVALSFISGYFYNRFAAYENFKAVGTMNFVRSALLLIMVGGLSWLMGLKGAVAGYLLHEMFVCGITASLNIRAHGRVGVRFQRELLIRAVRIGFPITLLWWVLTLSGTVDRIVLGSLLGPLAVGHYGLGLSLGSLLNLLPTAVGQVFYPRVNKQLGRGGTPESMKEIVMGPTLALGTLLANIQLAILICMPLLYNRLLPKYQPGLHAGEIFILGTFFACMMRNGANYLIAINQERIFLKYIFATLAFNVFSDIGLVKAGLGISGIAFGTSVAGLFLTTLVWHRAFRRMGFSRIKTWLSIAELYLPVGLLISMIACIHFVFPIAFDLFGVGTIFAGCAIFVILNSVVYCFPIYRNETIIWKAAFLTMVRSYSQRQVPVSTSQV